MKKDDEQRDVKLGTFSIDNMQDNHLKELSQGTVYGFTFFEVIQAAGSYFFTFKF